MTFYETISIDSENYGNNLKLETSNFKLVTHEIINMRF